jgi:hypothetical protein
MNCAALVLYIRKHIKKSKEICSYVVFLGISIVSFFMVGFMGVSKVNCNVDSFPSVLSPVYQNEGSVVKNNFSDSLMSKISPFTHVSEQEKRSYLERDDYKTVRTQGYEKGLLTIAGMVEHAMNSIFVGREIEAYRKENSNLSEKGFQVALEKKLSEILLDGIESKKIDVSHYQPSADHKRGYGKYLLYSNPDKSNPFCVQLFVFAEGQKTRLHNHIAPCSTTVLQGAVEESLYEPQSGQRKGSPLARFVSSSVRKTGSLAGFDDGQLNDVHKIRHLSLDGNHDYAITVHYYKDMDGVSIEKSEAGSLRKTPVDLVGKTNAAELFRKVESIKS